MATLHKFDARASDTRVDGMHSGAVLKMLGWNLLGIAIVLSIFASYDVREGTRTMIWTAGILALVGIVLVGIGQYRRAHSPL